MYKSIAMLSMKENATPTLREDHESFILYSQRVILTFAKENERQKRVTMAAVCSILATGSSLEDVHGTV